MGILGQLTHPRVVEAIGNIVKRARSAGRYVGMGMGADLEYAARAASQGVQWLQCGSDYEFMLQATDGMYDGIRKRIGVSAAGDARRFAARDIEP
jgi:2-keto-3-deoxy-L-rhamnonate aldolase RhmA